MFTTDLVNLYTRNIFKTSLYIYIFQDEKCRLMRNLSLSMVIPNFKSHIIMSARIYFMKTVNGCKDVSTMSPQDEQ